MSIKKLTGLLAFFLLSGYPVFAQQLLTLEDAVTYALQNKAEAVKARLDVENSEALIKEARAGILPRINGQAGLTHNMLLQTTALVMNGQTTTIKMGLPYQSSAVVQLDQQIFNSAVFTGLKAARSTREFYRINREMTEEQVIENVATSYYQIFKTESQIQTVDTTIANAERIKSVSDALYESGLIKKIDLDRMHVSLINLESQRQQLVNQLTLQKNTLKFLIGMPINEEFRLPENSFQPIEEVSIDNSIDISGLSTIRLLNKSEELLQYNKKTIRAQTLPVLSFSINYGKMGMGSRVPYFAGVSDGVRWSDFSSFSFNLTVPIFNGLSNQAQVKKASIEIEKNRADLADTKLALALALQNARAQIENSLITLNIQEENQRLAREVAENIENNYKNGLATFTDLLDAENAYANAQNNYSAAALDYKIAEIQLMKSQGTLRSFFINN